ncbi:MAG: hypothetical protein IJN10_08590 [Firmicutes bacterium]|nr:hypothetical protein [Bacillota bacterium]
MRLKRWMKVLELGLAGALWMNAAAWAAPVYNTQTDTRSLEHPDHEYDFEYGATQYVIDTQNRGVLHIHKSDEQQESLGDVTYTIYQVATIEQGKLSETGMVNMEYKSLIKDSTSAGNSIAIPSGMNSMQQLQSWVEGLMDGEDPTIRMGNQDELPSWSAVTDQNGNVTFDGDGEGLPLGLYIVYESSYSSRITEARPFVVSLPTATVNQWVYDVQAHPKNATTRLTVEKHIVANPGESTKEPEKMDDPSNDVLTDTEDFEMGQSIRYWMRADVPATIGELEVYYLLDRMSVGQSFVNDVAEDNRMARMQVWGRTVQGEMEYIPRLNGDVENYCVMSAEDMENVTNEQDYIDFYGNSMNMRAIRQPKAYKQQNAFAVLFNTQSLSEDAEGDGTTKRVPLYTEIYVTYDLRLNEKALVGQPGNVNDVALVVSHRTTDNRWDIENKVHVPENVFEAFIDVQQQDLDVINPQCVDTRVYTYAMQLTKVGEGTENMEGVTFKLCDSQGNTIKVSQYTEKDETFLAAGGISGRLWDYYVNPDAKEETEIVIDEDQQVYIYGLGDGVYQLVETKALNDYQLLKAPVVLTITSESADEQQPMSYCTDPEGAYFEIQAGKGYYIWQDEMKVRIDVSGHEVGSFVAVEGDVYSFDAKGDGGDMSQNEALVEKRFGYRYTDCESLAYRSNYGMEVKEDSQSSNGIFDSARGMYEDGLFAFTVLNRRSFNVPSAGGAGMTLYAVVGSGAGGLGIAGLAYYFKRKNKTHDA